MTKIDKIVSKIKSNTNKKVSHTFKLNSVLSSEIEKVVKENEITKTELIEYILNDYFKIK